MALSFLSRTLSSVPFCPSLLPPPATTIQVVLVQLAIPSRQDVEEYQNLRATVNELVGRINGRFGTVEFMPIHFMHKSVPFEELTAMYALADACLVTSTRDGMNLVCTLTVCRIADLADAFYRLRMSTSRRRSIDMAR